MSTRSGRTFRQRNFAHHTTITIHPASESVRPSILHSTERVVCSHWQWQWGACHRDRSSGIQLELDWSFLGLPAILYGPFIRSSIEWWSICCQIALTDFRKYFPDYTNFNRLPVRPFRFGINKDNSTPATPSCVGSRSIVAMLIIIDIVLANAINWINRYRQLFEIFIYWEKKPKRQSRLVNK